jgi:phosphohistidine swiveling domain-containing protein
MPGMMDTVLNLGINPEIANGIARQCGTRFAFDCYRRFLEMFGSVVLGVERARFEKALGQVARRRQVQDNRKLDGGALREVCNRFRLLIEEVSGRAMIDDPRWQLEMAIDAVLRSWQSPRAVEYRRAHRIANSLGTAVNVVAMVYGNRDDNSGTGVVFSRNGATGEKGIWGEFLVNAQGEDVVSGTRAPLPIEAMREVMPSAYDQLVDIVEMLECRRKQVVDVEFTVESGKLFILQVRKAKLAPEAAVTVAVHNVWDGRLTKAQALSQVTTEQLATVESRTFATSNGAKAQARHIAQGLAASPGCAVGRAVLSSEEAVAAKKRGEDVILVRPDTRPDDLPGMIAAVAVVTSIGGCSSHAALVARDLGKPCVVGVGDFDIKAGDIISVDGSKGLILAGRTALVGPVNKKEVNLFLRWARGSGHVTWRKPQLVFDFYEQPCSVHRLISDFYLSDTIASAVAGTRMESRAKSVRMRIHMEVAERLALYLVVAVGGELRHARPWGHEFNDAELNLLQREFGTVSGGDRRQAQVVTLHKLKTLGLAEQIRYLELAFTVFKEGSWYCGYGGHKWGAIASAALAFLKGELPHSTFADHTFDLQHNGGSVFGKNPMIKADDDDEEVLLEQLDDKKHAVDVADLYQRFERRHREAESAPLRFDFDVETLFFEGEQLGLWKRR